MKTMLLQIIGYKKTAIVLFLGASLCGQATASIVTYEELFTTTGNASISTINWSAYGGSTAVNISDVSPNSTLYLASAAGNPATPIGYLAAILGNTDAGSAPNRYPTYAAFESGLSLNLDAATISWRMNANVGATFRVRLMVMVDGNWYVSNTSDTAFEYYTPSTYGTGADFAAASAEAVTKSFDFSANAANWREFNLQEGVGMSVGSVLSSDLNSSTVSAIGFYVLGGNTGRIDTLQVTAVPEPSTFAAGLAAVVLFAGIGMRRRNRR